MTRDEKLRELVDDLRDTGFPGAAACIDDILAEPETDPAIERFMDGPRPKVVQFALDVDGALGALGSDGSLWWRDNGPWHRIRGPFDGEPTP